jgi:hypothetical protein
VSTNMGRFLVFKYPDMQVLWFWGVFFYHHTGYQNMWN